MHGCIADYHIHFTTDLGAPAVLDQQDEIAERLVAPPPRPARRTTSDRASRAAFTLRLDATLTPPQPGDTVQLHVPREHLHWFDSATGRQRPFSLKFVIFFNDDGPQAGTQTTYVFARAGNRLVRAVVRRFGWVLHHHINRELRADIRLVESLQIPPGPSLSGLTDRFDRPLVLRRRQHARRKAAAQFHSWRCRVHR